MDIILKINVIPPSVEFLEKSLRRLEGLAKPPGSLGGLEEIAARLCSIQASLDPQTKKRCVLVFAADNGVVEEGIASAPQRITAVQSINMLRGVTGVGALTRAYDCGLYVADVGVNAELNYPGIINRKIRRSTYNICKTAAMSCDEVSTALNTGAELAAKCREDGNLLIGIGEMGIGNTTTSTAVLAAILGLKTADDFVGRGAGLTDAAFQKKKDVVNCALELHSHCLDGDPVEILRCLGGFDLAAMTGAFLGGAAAGAAMVIDGLISAVAALCAVHLNPQVKNYLFASHRSFEKGYNIAVAQLGLTPYLSLDMRLGEGSGCPPMFGIMDGAVFMFKNMATFEEAEMGENYLEELGDIEF